LLACKVDLVITDETKQSVVQRAGVDVAKLLGQKQAPLAFVLPIFAKVSRQNICTFLVIFEAIN